MKTVLILLSLIVSFFILPVSVLAASGSNPVNTVDCTGAPDSPICKDLGNTSNPLFGPTGILTKVGILFGIFTGIVSVFMIIISGLRYVTSAGDPTKTANARKGIMYAAVGLVVSASAGGIAQFILSKV
jgi:uncharacterized metal-binding protein